MGRVRIALTATAVLAAALLGLVSCTHATIGPNRVIAQHGGWGIVAEIGEDGHLDALFIRAPEGVHFDDTQYIIRTGPSSQGRSSIRILRIPQPTPNP